jgi:hypothetical protein
MRDGLGVTVSEDAIREMVREVLSPPQVKSPKPIKPNPVVDPSASKTDPMDTNRKPKSHDELSVAITDIVKDIPKEEFSSVIDAVKDVKMNSNGGNKKQAKKTVGVRSVEEVVRTHVRKLINEIIPRFDTSFSGAYSDDGDEREYVRKKHETAVDVGGSDFEEIAKEMGFSVSGAKQAVDKAMTKSQWLGQKITDPDESDELELTVLMAMDEYIKMLSKSGELTPADVQLMRDHPDIVRDLDGFREFLDKHLRRLRSSETEGEPYGPWDKRGFKFDQDR